MALQSAIIPDPSPDIVNTRSIVLTGTNTSDINTITVSGAAAVVQPTNITWRTEVRLVPGDNEIKISGIDLAGNTTAEITKTVRLPKLIDKQHLVHNVFDEFGIVLALDRLPGEKNHHYRNRLLDVRLHPADTTVRGLTFGASRELGIKIVEAMSISSPLDGELGTNRAINGRFKTNGIYFDFASPRLRTTECYRVEPATLSVSLVEVPRDEASIAVQTINGDRIPVEDWNFDKKTNRILFQDRNLANLDVNIIFEYIKRIALDSLTLQDLKDELELIVDGDGKSLLTVSIDTDPSTPAEDLIPTSGFVFIDENPVTIERSSLRVRELHDIDFQKSNWNAEGHAIDTKLQGWAQSINTQTRIVWNATLLDDSQWEPLGPEPSLGALPHLSNAKRGYWFSQDPSDATEYTRKDYRRYNGVSPISGALLKYRGIKPLEFQSGTGTKKDLKVLDIVEE